MTASHGIEACHACIAESNSHNSGASVIINSRCTDLLRSTGIEAFATRDRVILEADDGTEAVVLQFENVVGMVERLSNLAEPHWAKPGPARHVQELYRACTFLVLTPPGEARRFPEIIPA